METEGWRDRYFKGYGMEVELGSKLGEVDVIYSVLYCKSLLLLVVLIKKTVLLELSMKASWTIVKEAR